MLERVVIHEQNVQVQALVEVGRKYGELFVSEDELLQVRECSNSW